MNLDDLLKRTRKGAAAESAASYFGDLLAELERRAANEIEAAMVSGADHRRTLATAEWMAYRKILRRFEQDIKTGRSAEKEL